jgi:hypothetical protein
MSHSRALAKFQYPFKHFLRKLKIALLKKCGIKKLWFIAHLRRIFDHATLTYADMPAKSFS